MEENKKTTQMSQSVRSFGKSIKINMVGYLISTLILEILILLTYIKYRNMEIVLQGMLVAPILLFVLMCGAIFLLGGIKK